MERRVEADAAAVEASSEPLGLVVSLLPPPPEVVLGAPDETPPELLELVVGPLPASRERDLGVDQRRSHSSISRFKAAKSAWRKTGAVSRRIGSTS